MKRFLVMVLFLLGIGPWNLNAQRIDFCFNADDVKSNTWTVFINGITYGKYYQLVQIGIVTTASPFIDLEAMQKWMAILHMEIPKETFGLRGNAIMQYINNKMLKMIKKEVGPEKYPAIEERITRMLGWAKPCGDYEIITRWRDME